VNVKTVGVVDERLRRHQREAEERATRVAAEHRPRDLAEAGALARLQLDLVRAPPAARAAGRSLTCCSMSLDDPLGLVVPAVERQPARALRHVAAHEQDAEREDRAHREREPPADVGVEQVGVQQDAGDAAPNAAPSQ
jgi:hypothetical protein